MSINFNSLFRNINRLWSSPRFGFSKKVAVKLRLSVPSFRLQARYHYDTVETDFFWSCAHGLAFLFLRVLLHKFFDATGGIYELLFTCKERVTVRAYFNFQKLPWFCRTSLKCISANASNRHYMIFWMNTASH